MGFSGLRNGSRVAVSHHVCRGSKKGKTNATLSRGRTGREVGSFAYLRCEAEGSAPPGVLEPPTEIVNIFGSRVPAAG